MGKRPKSYYINCAKKNKWEPRDNVLSPNMSGFLCTCNDRERQCVQEAYNLLNDFADKLYGKDGTGATNNKDKDNCLENSENSSQDDQVSKTDEVAKVVKADNDDDDDDGDDDLDIDAAVKADVAALKEQGRSKNKVIKRFQQVKCNSNNCIFIKTTIEDPVALSMAIMDDIIKSQLPRTKILIRLLPVQRTCKAYPEDIIAAAKEMAKEYFKDESKSFCVVCKIRNNSGINKDIRAILAEKMKEANPNNVPNLINPEVVFNVDIIKSSCCLSFLPGYLTKYKKYNLIELINKKVQKDVDDDDDAQCSKPNDETDSLEKENGNTSADTQTNDVPETKSVDTLQ